MFVYRHGIPHGISLLPGIRGPAAVLGDHASMRSLESIASPLTVERREAICARVAKQYPRNIPESTAQDNRRTDPGPSRADIPQIINGPQQAGTTEFYDRLHGAKLRKKLGCALVNLGKFNLWADRCLVNMDDLRFRADR